MRLLVIIGMVSVMSIVVGLSIASPSINNFDDFVYQLNEPFDGAQQEQIAEHDPILEENHVDNPYNNEPDHIRKK